MRHPIHRNASALLVAVLAAGTLILPHPLQNALAAQETGQIRAVATVVDGGAAWEGHSIAQELAAAPEWEEARAGIHATALRMTGDVRVAGDARDQGTAPPAPTGTIAPVALAPRDEPILVQPPVEIRRGGILGELGWDGPTPVITVAVLDQ